MLNIVIEGARGTGKSTVSQYIRQNTTNSTLINFTGFNEKGEAGLQKVAEYYGRWGAFFQKFKGEDNIFIHDRYFFSEMVYSKLYKDYDFSECYNFLTTTLPHFYDNMYVIILVAEEDDFRKNLDREKIRLFGNLQDTVEQSMKQQEAYISLGYGLINSYSVAKVYSVHVRGKTVKEIGEEILSISRGELEWLKKKVDG